MSDKAEAAISRVFFTIPYSFRTSGERGWKKMLMVRYLEGWRLPKLAMVIRAMMFAHRGHLRRQEIFCVGRQYIALLYAGTPRSSQ